MKRTTLLLALTLGATALTALAPTAAAGEPICTMGVACVDTCNGQPCASAPETPGWPEDMPYPCTYRICLGRYLP